MVPVCATRDGVGDRSMCMPVSVTAKAVVTVVLSNKCVYGE